MRQFTVALHRLVAESTINGFAKARSRWWKDVLFDGRTPTQKIIDESVNDLPNTSQYEKVEQLAGEILAAVKAEVAAQVDARLKGREGGDGNR